MSRREGYRQKRTRAERNGRRGETVASLYLKLTGWRILAKRVRTPRGEIDLIARRGGTVCFVEVKWRGSAAQLDSAISVERLRRVAAATEAVAARYARGADEIRIDVLLVAPFTWPRRIVNAWQPGA